MVAADLNRLRPQNAFATPLVFLDGQSKEERLMAAKQMVERALCLQSVLAGRLNWDDYLMLLDDHGIDAINTHDMFAEGIHLL